MSLDKIHLPPLVLQQLFTHSLIDSTNEEKKNEQTASDKFKFLGYNRQHIVILVDNDQTLYLPNEELNFLLGILPACHLGMDDVAILNIKKNAGVTHKTIGKEFKSEKIFLFGVSPGTIELPLDFPYYQIQRYNDQTYLYTPSLAHFHDNKEEKTKLWNCLKQIFGIK